MLRQWRVLIAGGSTALQAKSGAVMGLPSVEQRPLDGSRSGCRSTMAIMMVYVYRVKAPTTGAKVVLEQQRRHRRYQAGMQQGSVRLQCCIRSNSVHDRWAADG